MKKFILLAIFLLYSFTTYARKLDYQEITINIIEQQQQIFQFYIKLNVEIFNPISYYPLEKGLETNLQSLAQEQKNYKQNIIWIRNEFLGVETLDSKGELKHLIMQDQNQKIFKSISLDKKFNTLEVFPLFSLFYPKYEQLLLENYEELGINYLNAGFFEKDLNFFYKLGNDQFYLLINTENYRTELVHRIIHHNGVFLPLETKFTEWNPKVNIPKVTEHYINYRLFKKDIVEAIFFKNLVTRKNEFLRKHRSHLL